MSWLDAPFIDGRPPIEEEEVLLPDGFDELGVEMPDFQSMPDEEFDVSPADMFFESLAGNLRGVQAPRPRNFLEGLAVGGVQGLSARGMRSLSAREKFDKRKEERRKAIDEGNKQATQRYQAERGGELRARRAEDRLGTRTDAKERAKRDFEASPAYLAQLENESKARATGTRKAAEGQPETPAERRARESSDRAADAARRAADASDRKVRLDSFQSVNELGRAYKDEPAIKGYRNLLGNVRTGEAGAAQKTGPGDIALIFSYMRALEPDNPNAVREGEYSSARKATGLLNTARNLPSQYYQGNQLTESGRQHFLKTMRAALKSRKPDFDVANSQYRRRAEMGGVDPTLILYDDTTQIDEVVPSKGRTPIMDFDP